MSSVSKVLQTEPSSTQCFFPAKRKKGLLSRRAGGHALLKRENDKEITAAFAKVAEDWWV